MIGVGDKEKTLDMTVVGNGCSDCRWASAKRSSRVLVEEAGKDEMTSWRVEAKGWTWSSYPKAKARVEGWCRKNYRGNSSRHSSLRLAIRFPAADHLQSVKFQLYTSTYPYYMYTFPQPRREFIFRKEWGGR